MSFDGHWLEPRNMMGWLTIDMIEISFRSGDSYNIQEAGLFHLSNTSSLIQSE